MHLRRRASLDLGRATKSLSGARTQISDAKEEEGGDGGGGGKEKEKLPGEDIQTYITKIDALQGKMDAMMRASEDATSGHEAAKKALEKERLDRKDNVDYLQAELAKRKAENDALKEKYVQLEEAKEAQAKRLGGQLEKAQETMQKQEQQLQARADEVAQLNDNLIELGQLKTNAAADVTLKGSMSSELESLRFKLNESQQQLTVLAMADGRRAARTASACCRSFCSSCYGSIRAGRSCASRR